MILSFLVFSFLCDAVAQQTAVRAKWRFHSADELGLLNGESKSALHLQSVNGFQRKNWFAGIGAGLDYYKYRSVPVFADARKYFGKTRNQFFVYADAGVHFVFGKNNPPGYYEGKYIPCFYGAAGIGYRAGLKNGTGLLLSAGYSYKKIVNRQKLQPPCISYGACTLQVENYTYDLNRLLFQIGWMF